MKRLLGIALLVGLAACGSEPGQDAAPEASVLPAAPPGTDIYLADLSRSDDGTLSVSTPANITERPGYDNQPFFVPDGSGFWFTAIDEHDGQADIWRYDIGSGLVERVTVSNPESEYSATPLPDGSGISVIRVEADSAQRLWRFDPDGSNGAVLFENIAPVGYHAWADDNTVVMFVLGEPATLQMADTDVGEAVVLAEGIGRTIHRIPGTNDVSFVQRHEDGTASVMRLRPDTREIEELIATIEGSDLYGWTPDGTLLMGHEAKLFAWALGAEAVWNEIADFADTGISITRLAVSPDGSHIAIVGEVGPA